MRQEDIIAIKRTIALVRIQCQEHERCKECKLYVSGVGCVMDRPPAYLNEDEIIEALQ